MKRMLQLERMLAGVALVAIGSVACAQSNPTREEAIWNAAANRLERQNDLWFKEGDYPRVIQSLRLATAILPVDYDLVTSLGWMLENVKQYDEALAVYIKYRRDNPTDPDAAFPEANYYYLRRVYAKIPPLLEPSIKDPVLGRPHPNVFRVLAHSYDRLNLLADSKRVWSELVKLTNDPAAIRNLERVEAKMKTGRR